jgi:hypothetical protein
LRLALEGEPICEVELWKAESRETAAGRYACGAKCETSYYFQSETGKPFLWELFFLAQTLNSSRVSLFKDLDSSEICISGPPSSQK